MAEMHNFQIDQGTTWNRTITWANDSGTPYNLTGYTARMHLKRQKRDQTPTESLTTESGNITITPLTGQILLSLSPAETAGLSGAYFYDLELVSSGSAVTRLLQGQVLIDDEVTR